MFSYFAVIPKIHNDLPAARKLSKHILSTLSNYTIALDTDKLIYLHNPLPKTGVRHYFLSDQLGIIAGTLFNRQSTSFGRIVPTIFPPSESNLLSFRRGLPLIDNYWGRYTAFIVEPNFLACNIIADPAGIIPVYVYENKSFVVCFSDAEDFIKIGLTALTFNKQHIVAAIKYPNTSWTDTGFNEISKIPPGFCLRITGHGSVEKTLYWDIGRFCRSDAITNPYEAAYLLNKTLTDCAHEWASQYDSVMLRLSGGLDSSTILACLATAPHRPQITCVNYFSSQAGSDERALARQIAERYAVTLLEIEDNPDTADINDFNLFPLAPEILSWLPQFDRGRIESSIFEQVSAQSLFDGEGGDCLFHQGAEFCIEDYVQRYGINLGLLREAFLYGRLKRFSLWAALMMAMKASIQFRQLNYMQLLEADNGSSIFLSDSYLQSVDGAERHSYWLNTIADLPLAKQLQASIMRLCFRLYAPNAACRYMLSTRPMLSQPFIELCLRIPTFLFRAETHKLG